ncbi:MAG: universal stress protein, partial [bacterium]|nr:universal stress protein [bacterium]
VVAVRKELPHWVGKVLPDEAGGEGLLLAGPLQERLETMVAGTREAGVEVFTRVLVGVPFIEIIRQVLRGDHDIVIKDPDTVASGGRVTVGSTAMHLLRKCPCPVWLVRKAVAGRFERILAAVDPEPGDTVRNALNKKILELSTSLAAFEECELFIVRAWDSIAEEFPAVRSHFDDYETYMEQIHMVRVKATDEFLGQFHGDPDKFDVRYVTGMPEAVIPEVAEKEQVDLVVMGTVGRTGIPGLLIGSTAESVLGQIECSVLAVKPEGFVSPVTLEDDA